MSVNTLHRLKSRGCAERLTLCMPLLWLLVVVCGAGPLASAAEADAREIMRQALTRIERNDELKENYIYEETVVVEHLNKDGSAKKVEEERSEVFFVDGTEIERKLAKNGKPLSSDDAAKEQRRVDKEIAKIRGQSAEARAKRRKERDEDKEHAERFRRQVLEGYDLALLGVEKVEGRTCYRISGRPKPGYKFTGKHTDRLESFAGEAWIEKGTYEWVQLKLSSIKQVNWGWFIFRLQPGAEMEMAQTKVNDEIWLPKKVRISANARLFGKAFRVRIRSDYSNFRKFSTDSQLILTGVQ